MSYINPLQDTSGNLTFSSNSTSILDKSLYYNYWNDINQKPSFCNIAFSGNYNHISNKPNLNPLSTSSNLYYSSNSYYSSFSNLDYITSNNLISFADNKLNNLNSSLWGTIENNIYSNLGSVGIGTSSFGNNKLVIQGNLKSDDLKIKGMGFSNLLITSNILDNKSNLLYNSISNQDYLSKNNQITSSQFTTDANKNLYINYFSNYNQSFISITSTCNSLVLSQNSLLTFNYINQISINSGTYNVVFNNGSITFGGLNPDKSYPILKRNNVVLNPLVWYKFDNSTNLGYDEMRNHDLTNNNTVAFNSIDTTKGSGSASFNGTTQYLSKMGAFTLNNKDWSISCWVKKTNNNVVDRIFSLGSVYNIYEVVVFGYNFDNTLRIDFWGSDLISSSSHTDAGYWTHLVITFKSGSRIRKIYRNGLLIGNDIAAGELITNTNFYIGFTSGRFFNGLMDDFRIYEYELTLQEIQELYKGRVDIFSSSRYTSNIGIGTSSNLANDLILINGNTNVNDFKIKGTSSSNLLITSNILDNSSNSLIENFNSIFNKYHSSIWSNTTNSSIYITSNLGIGSTIPNEKLDIIGNIGISGSILPNSCNSFDLGSLDKKWKDLYISRNSIYLNDFIIKNSNNYLDINNIDVSSINFLNNLNTNSNKISLNTNGDFMIGNKYLLGINGGLYSSNIIFSNVLSNSSNSLINLNNSKFNSSNSTDLIKIGNKRFITNDIYNRPATFTGILESYNLTTSNLNVIGDYTNFNTTIYQTEQLFVENSCNYPSMIVKQMNINKNVAEFYNSNYSINNVSVSGTGNSINIASDNSNYSYAYFASNGTLVLNDLLNCEIFMIGGGGGGGYNHGGGGGAGAYYRGSIILNAGSYSITIGNGGTQDNSGGNTIISLGVTNIFIVNGGGKGGSFNSPYSGTNGGCGGGGTGWNNNYSTNTTWSGGSAINTGTNGSGFGGGSGINNFNGNSLNGGGGGGIGGIGQNAPSGQTGTGAAGGNALNIDITGVNVVYGGGGGGGVWGDGTKTITGGLGGGVGSIYVGGQGGKTAVQSGGNGVANTGSGGGGGGPAFGVGGTGGSGVVIIRYFNKKIDIQMKFLVNSNGNVGIGTIHPLSKLDVVGSINSTGLVVNNNDIINQIKTNDNNYSNSIFNSWNYSNNLFTSLSNSFENIKNSKQDLLNSSTILLGNGANITNVNYNNLINKANLSIYSTSVNSTSNSLFTNLSNLDYYSSNSNISYVNNGTNNLIKFLWNTNGNNIFTNSNIGIGSFIPAFSLDIDGNLNTNEFLIKKGNLSNSFITSNIFDNKSNNYYSSLSNLDFNSSNSNVNYVNNIVNTAINNYNSYLDSIDLWKTGVNNKVYINSNISILDNINNLTNLNTNITITSNLGSITNSITSSCNALVLSGNSLARFNYTNDVAINSGTYNVVFNNGAIAIGETPYVRPWGAYFANDWSGTTLLDSSGNNKHAVTGGTIIKTTASGNGATGLITYISGGTSATISFPDGSIPSSFTILGLTRYNGGTRGRILQSRNGGNWLLGHWNGRRGKAYFEGWKTAEAGTIGNLDDWLCIIGRNSGTTPNNILVDGTGQGNATGGTGNYHLGINTGSGEYSDWCLSAVIIYDSHLTDAHMSNLNNFINTYKTDGNIINLKTNILRNIDKSYPILKDANGNNINPVIWYKFDNSINLGYDEMNTYNLTNNNSVSYNSVNLIKGSGSSSYNGTNQYLSINNFYNLSGISFTYSVWIYPFINTSTNIVFFTGFGSIGNTNQRFVTGYWNGNFGFDFQNDIVLVGSNYNDINTWINWICSFNSTNKEVKIYRNGVLVKTGNMINQLNTGSSLIFTLGCRANIEWFYNGLIDDFRIYNFVLTSNQVQELYKGRVDIYNYNYTNNYSSNLLIKGDMNISGNLKINNNLLRLTETPNISITGSGNSINNVLNDSNYKYALFTSNGTFSVDKNIICDILVVGGGGGGGTDSAGGGGGGQVLYYTDNIVSFKSGGSINLSIGTYNINIGSGGAGGSGGVGSAGNSSTINLNNVNILSAGGGGGGGSAHVPKPPNAIGGGGGGSGGSTTDKTGASSTGGGGTGGTSTGEIGGGGGGGANISSASKNGTNATSSSSGSGGSGVNINITGNIIGVGGGGSGGSYLSGKTIGTATHGGGIGYSGYSSATSGTANTGGGGGGAGYSGYGAGSGGSGVVIIRYAINQPFFNGLVNYSNVRNRPYLLDLLTSSNIINIGEGNNLNFPLAITSWKNEWFLFIGTSPTNVPNSFIFHHITPIINSKWWFNGTTSTTKAEISDERVKKDINDLSNGLHKLMLLNPKEYFLCDEKDYHKKYGIIAQDVSQIPELSHLVHKDTDFIANIYSSGSYDNSNGIFIINSSKKIDGLIEINDELKILLDNQENQEIIIEELPYENRYKKRFVKVKNIINDYSFEIFDDIELNDFEKSNLFIYGRKINDFLKLDYSSLYTLNIKANQEIYDIINNSYNTLNNLTTRIKNLEDKSS